MEPISKQTRRAFQEHLTAWVLRDIDAVFQDAGIELTRPLPPEQSPSGARRALVADYYNSVDWSSADDVRKVLVAYESVLAGSAPEQRTKLLASLKRDGVEYRDERLHSTSLDLSRVATASARVDASTLREHLRRITASIESDPGLAIGSAKELVESVARQVIDHYGGTVNPNESLTKTVKTATDLLDLAVDKIPDAAKGAPAIKQVLAGLGQLVGPMAELRNLYGTGHGRTRTSGVKPRHARLVVGAATALATFLLETLDERRTPPP